MSLSNLTAGGWVILALAMICTFGFVTNVAKRDHNYAALAGTISAILWTLVLRLVLP